MEVLGIPPTPVMDQATRKRLFFDSKGNPRCITNSKGKKRRVASKELPQAVKTSDAHFLDFIRRCLEWDPNHRLTPEEALQHDWIKEALVPRKDRAARTQHKRVSASPASSDAHTQKAQHHHHHHHHHQHGHHNHHSQHHHGSSGQTQPQTDPYKVPAQPPIREQTKEEWKLNLKDHRSARTQRVPPVGAPADANVDESSARVPSAKSSKTQSQRKAPPAEDVIEEKVEKLNLGAGGAAGGQGETIKLSFQSHLAHQEEDKFLPPIAK
ncbi:dual specificity tyrosine-phosphorylation-regulated kinase 4 [Plakobranchus ocellatus]|uniref:Dual specificity tyrosine-phosphorylation-regulated kinase 4 n=1 Tax=Plakobranchus ocellatus TaxID=259542 RepID=A0AAV4D303_9GAST|nr:dual specificity tyrosine-phosphorylation-regulated kinase 4 [Plakobranchus ocellatus]